MAMTGTSHSSTTIVRPLRPRGPLAAGHLEVVADLGGAVVAHLLLESHPAGAADRAERPVAKDLSRREGTPEIRPHMEGSIVQMKKTTSGGTSPSASEPPLDFRAQPAPSLNSGSIRCCCKLSSQTQWSVPRAGHMSTFLTRRRIVIGNAACRISRVFL
jgi:hypothetical protein